MLTQPTADEPTTGRVALTDRHLKGYQRAGTPREVWDAEQPGLMVRVRTSGRIEFTVRYRHAGKRKRLKLGVYGALTLAKARREARHAQARIDAGDDPAGARQSARLAPDDTVAALAADYLKRHARPNKRTHAEDARVLDVEVLPKWRDRSVRELSRRDVRGLVEAIVDRGSPVMANRVLAVIRRMLNFAVDHDWIDANPAARMTKPTREVSRDRVLSDDELRRLWRCLERFPATHEKQAPGRRRAKGTPDDPVCPFGPALAAVQKVRLLTAQRGGEVVRMRWADLDIPAANTPKTPRAGWWTIPGADTKNGETHRVPLTDRVIGLIEAQRTDDTDEDGYVFVGSGASLKDRAKKASALLSKALGFAFRGHDLRRTAATRMAEAGVPRDHISRVLNHVEGGARATRVYDRHGYDAEKRLALETWDRALMAILNETASEGAEVVSIARRR